MAWEHCRRAFSTGAIGLAAAVILSGAAEGAAPISLAQLANPARPVIDPSVQQALSALRYSPAELPPQAGVARTSIDRSLGKGGLTASAGFLCGRHASPDNNGAATERGYDPEGRFVGAKLSFAFK